MKTVVTGNFGRLWPTDSHYLQFVHHVIFLNIAIIMHQYVHLYEFSWAIHDFLAPNF